jgi:SagB-type dehydrogenase family enzyme
VLANRRTVRRYSTESITFDELSAILSVAADPVDTRPPTPDDHRYGNVFKASPSGGARHPTEFYVHATRVDGLPSGFYHYSPLLRGFEALDLVWSAGQLSFAAGDQPWITRAAAIVVYTAVLDRSRWKYDFGRALRFVLVDLGHVSQTVYLAATALEIGVGFAGALRDEPIEKALGCDPDREMVLGLTALGRPEVRDPLRAALADLQW